MLMSARASRAWVKWGWAGLSLLLLLVILYSGDRSVNLSFGPARALFVARGQVGFAWWDQEKLKLDNPVMWKKPVNFTLRWLPTITGGDYRQIALPLWPVPVITALLAWRERRREAKRPFGWGKWGWEVLTLLLLIAIVYSGDHLFNFSLGSGSKCFVANGQAGYAWWDQEKLKLDNPTVWKKATSVSLRWLPTTSTGDPDFRQIALPLWPLPVITALLAWRLQRREARQPPPAPAGEAKAEAGSR
jgi:hypothetical protein